MDNQNIAIFDFDNTLIKGQSQNLLISYLYKKNRISLLKYFLISLWFLGFKLGFPFSLSSIFNYALRDLKGKDVEDYNQLFDEFFIQICIPNFYKNSKAFVDFIKGNGVYTVLISSAIDPIIIRAKEYFGFNEFVCTKLEKNGHVYTGNIDGKIIYGKVKIDALQDILKHEGSAFGEVFVFADHYTDIPLLLQAHYPVAVNPDKKLFLFSKKKKWPMLYLDSDESVQHFQSNIVS